jgi:hypothetical protein
MNQFLVGLVERATLRVPVLERRTRSLFEPVAPTMDPIAVGGAEQAEPEELDEHLGPSQLYEATSPPRPEPGTGGGLETHSTQIASPAAAAAVLPPPGSPASPTSSPTRPVDGEQRLVLPTAARHGELERVTELETTLATARPLPPPARERRQLPMPARMSTQRSPTRHATDVVHAPPRAHNVQPPSADSLLPGPAPTAIGEPPVKASVPLLQSGPRIPGPPALLVRSQAGPPALQPNGIEAPPPAPVHVTIGRIEVRATSPAADRPPVRRPPAGPRMTLEGYLNGRRGGSR